MKLIIQRVKKASVVIDGVIFSAINSGLLVFLGVSCQDTPQSVDYFVQKLLKLRIFEDSSGKMNLDIQQVGGEILVVSQFTLYANCRKGNRPSFKNAAAPDIAEDIYNQFIQKLQVQFDRVRTGQFGAMMEVDLLNDGPVTLILE